MDIKFDVVPFPKEMPPGMRRTLDGMDDDEMAEINDTINHLLSGPRRAVLDNLGVCNGDELKNYQYLLVGAGHMCAMLGNDVFSAAFAAIAVACRDTPQLSIIPVRYARRNGKVVLEAALIDIVHGSDRQGFLRGLAENAKIMAEEAGKEPPPEDDAPVEVSDTTRDLLKGLGIDPGDVGVDPAVPGPTKH